MEAKRLAKGEALILEAIESLRKELDPDRLLDLKGAAAVLGVSMPTIYRVSAQPDFPVIRLGRLIRVRKRALIEFVEKSDLSKLSV